MIVIAANGGVSGAEVGRRDQRDRHDNDQFRRRADHIFVRNDRA
jgi:hypothetical protein